MNQCAICQSTQSLNYHHKIPRSNGGPDDDSNRIWLCANHHELIHVVASNLKRSSSTASDMVSQQYVVGSTQYNLIMELAKIIFFSQEKGEKASTQRVTIDIPRQKYIDIKDNAKRCRVSVQKYILEVITRFG